MAALSYLPSTIKTYNDEFIDRNMKKVFCYYWEPQKNPRALVHISHGFGEHAMVHNDIAVSLAMKEFFVFAHDNVGHGQSDGSSADFGSFNVILDDIQFHVDMMKKKYPGLPVFLVGHSMGGTAGILLGIERPNEYSGIVAIAPAIILNYETVSYYRVVLANIIGKIFPIFPMIHCDYSLACNDPEQLKNMNDDPLRFHGYFRSRPTLSIIQAGNEITEKKEQLVVPYLILHGDSDKVVHISGSEDLHKHSASKDKTLKVYPGGCHHLSIKPNGIAEDVHNRIMQWLEDRA